MKPRPRLSNAWVLVGAVLLLAGVLFAVRSNWGTRELWRLEKKGQHEEAAFHFRAGLDFFTINQRLWSDVVLPEDADAIYERAPKIFGQEWSGPAYEEPPDTPEACLFLFNREGVSRNVEKGRFTEAMRERLELRARLYIDDVMDVDSGFGGDFSYAKKAMVLEAQGLFEAAASRRELAGRYALRVLTPHAEMLAEEEERVHQDAAAATLYRKRAASWQRRGREELRRSDGDRQLARLGRCHPDRPMDPKDRDRLLLRALTQADPDTRMAAARIVAATDVALFEDAWESLAQDLKLLATEDFVRAGRISGLAMAANDATWKAPELPWRRGKLSSEGERVRWLRHLEAALAVPKTREFAIQELSGLRGETPPPEEGWSAWVERTTAGRRPGVSVRTALRDEPTRDLGVFPRVDFGMRLQANFPRPWYRHWRKADLFPLAAKGPFRAHLEAWLWVPHAGMYRFYAKTEVKNRAQLSLTIKGTKTSILGPSNDAELQFVYQVGLPTHRIDFSHPVPLETGWTLLSILYEGPEVQNLADEHLTRIAGPHPAGLQLFWSSDRHLRELIPEEYLCH